ncbi:hypothetical protein PGTUg99_028079 [Puccinia graminis f. sp. tritici]|uniref:Uncharacterized protein n=1 Tax=Puccinia graminis f. sp. tritici TaxID=56615 RepID=A0A5B0MHN9_PUCGR|nr:hypothetical protein PGTUg99_036815 [Puccinia graminis f. sp. tritici]KAA1138893.1 hypothetical protein PGTUg99_028079 [Puccinia graminis f. sp. tritici]
MNSCGHAERPMATSTWASAQLQRGQSPPAARGINKAPHISAAQSQAVAEHFMGKTKLLGIGFDPRRCQKAAIVWSEVLTDRRLLLG